MDAVPFCGWARLTVKAQKLKDSSEEPQTLGEHLKKRRRELGLLQREAAERMGIGTDTYANWENGRTKPVAAQFRPVVEFLGYDPTPEAKTLRERLEIKRRTLGATFDQMAKHLGWDRATLTRYLKGTWRMPPARAEAFERLLSATTSELEAIYRLPRRLRGERKASRRGPT
jgi:transcriptional regulator with XRE-family HTH domain